MKKLLFSSLLACCLPALLFSCLLACCLPAVAQTNSNPGSITNTFVSGPLADLFTFVSSTSNLIVAPYGLVSTDGKDYGGGVGLAYRVTPILYPTLRFDYLSAEKTLYEPSATLQLQAPLLSLGPVRLAPFIYSGVTTPIAGAGASNGNLGGVFGAGAALILSSHFDLVGAFEKRTVPNRTLIGFGFAYKF